MEVFMGKLNTKQELADFFNVPLKYLTYFMYVKKPETQYQSFQISKKNGGFRKISAPLPELEKLQSKVADKLSKLYEGNAKNFNVAQAYREKKGIYTNARVHRNKRIVLNVDLENFFDTFHFGRVAGFFEKNNTFLMSRKNAIMISNLVCYQGKLPQGAPTSPVISNFIFQIVDIRIFRLMKKYRLNYSRYADDMTFSTNDSKFFNQIDEFLLQLTKLINKSGFKINTKKTRVSLKNSRQEVTGLVVNKTVNVPRTFAKNTRSMADHLYRSGEFIIDGKKGNIKQLEGRFTYIADIDMKNSSISNKNKNGSKEYLKEFSMRNQHYRRFIFLRNLIFNEKPLIVTEGKTDIKYLEAALKNLHAKYPELVKLDTLTGHFNFKVSFFKRTNKVQYYLGMNFDGADSILTLYNYYESKSSSLYPYTIKDMRKKNTLKVDAINPVMFLFDNEISKNCGRPLRKFLNATHADKSMESHLMQNLPVKFINDENLFLLATIREKEIDTERYDCEIEDLFTSVTLEHEINGKKFVRSGNGGKNTYSKELFAEYVSRNYATIDFSGFEPLLNNIRDVITSYKKMH